MLATTAVMMDDADPVMEEADPGGTLESVLLSAREDINGTLVYTALGEDMGSVHDVLIDAASGRVVYGVVQVGGVLGLGADHYPVPFERLRYDNGLGGYITDVSLEDLDAAPPHEDDWRDDRGWQAQAYDHYGVRPHWL